MSIIVGTKRNSRHRSNSTSASPAARPVSRFAGFGWFVSGAIVTGLFFAAWSASEPTSPPPRPIAPTAESATSSDYSSLNELVAMSNEEIAEQDIAVLNLTSAVGLPGTEQLDIARSCRTLDDWAEHVRRETDRHLYKYRESPREYENSEGYFRMLMLITVLQQDLRVRYNPARIHEPDFTNSRDLFIHGMIGSSNGGTCSSMPVLYAAVARRLGYPVHLVLAKGHIFCRWEDSRDRFNIEGAGIGMNTFEDNYYRKWPIPINDKEMERGVYLRNLTPAEEFGVFLSARGYCLEDNDRLADAYLAYAQAYRFSSGNPEYLVALKLAVNKTLIPIARREGTIPVKSTFELPPRPSEIRAQALRSGIPPINFNPPSIPIPTNVAKPVLPDIDPWTGLPRDNRARPDYPLHPTLGELP